MYVCVHVCTYSVYARYITCVELLPTAGHLQSNSVLHRSSGTPEEPCPRACYHLHSHSLIDFVFSRTYMLHCRQCCGDLKEPVRRTQGTDGIQLSESQRETLGVQPGSPCVLCVPFRACTTPWFIIHPKARSPSIIG